MSSLFQGRILNGVVLSAFVMAETEVELRRFRRVMDEWLMGNHNHVAV